MAGLVPAQTNAERVGRAVLEERVGPGNGERVERVCAAEDGVAAGLGNDAHALRSVDLERGRRDHADDRAFAAARARARAADEAKGVLTEHDVGEGLLIAVLDRRSGQRPEEADVAAVAIERALAAGLRVTLLRHDESIVAQRRAHLHALGTALAVVWVDEDSKVGRLDAPLGRDVGVLRGVDEVRSGGLRGQRRVRLLRGERVDRPGQRALWLSRRHDCAVGAGADTGHATDALLGDEGRDHRRQGAEIANACGGRGDETSGDASVCRKLDVGHTAPIGIDDGLVEVLDVLGDVEGLG